MKRKKPDRETIVVGIIYNDARDSVLLSRRKTDVHQGDLWEYPGGKLLDGESPRQALQRELSEELGILIEDCHPLKCVDYEYPDKSIRLNVRVVDEWAGQIQANEGQPLEWVLINELDSREMPAANGPINKLVNLPPLYLISPDRGEYGEAFLSRTGYFLESGLKLLQFRSRLSAFHEHERAVRRLAVLCERYSAGLLYNGTAEQAERAGTHGVHLSSSELLVLRERPLPATKWVAASCHNDREIEHAVKIGVDFCVLSPVHRSPSHPVGTPLGWQGFRLLAAKSTIPVYALGGIRQDELCKARNNGAHGIAMISGVWDAPDPDAVIRRLSR